MTMAEQNGLFQIDTGDPMPIYAQLERAIKASVTMGRLRLGDQLPTVRQLAVDLRINANTVAKVYAELERIGILETKRGVGTFVRSHPGEIGDRRDREGDLAALTERFLDEAAMLGFTFDQVLACLTGERKKENR
jgi:GntR family transcriptional regulator